MSDTRIGKYLRVSEMPNPGKKSKVWAVLTNRDDEIGTIEWYVPWRQYVLAPDACTVFNSGCMKDVCAFLDRVNKREVSKGKRDDDRP